jgi:ubiquinone/menaquinone biosynthesis C-methylase UbiE
MSSSIAPNLDSTISFFDRRAADYDREYTEQTPGGYALRVRRQRILQLFDKPGGEVLDVGCGPGVMAQAMVDLGCTFWGLDPSERMLEICRGRFKDDHRIKFLSGEATRIGFPDESFDAVLCMGVIDSVPDVRQSVSEMLRVLRPGGTLLITFTNVRSPYSWWKKRVFYPGVAVYHAFSRNHASSRDPKTPPPDAGKRMLFTRVGACRLLQTAGADVAYIEGYYFNVFLSPLDELFPRSALLVTRKFEEGIWKAPEWVASGWIVKARKRKVGA